MTLEELRNEGPGKSKLEQGFGSAAATGILARSRTTGQARPRSRIAATFGAGVSSDRDEPEFLGQPRDHRSEQTGVRRQPRREPLSAAARPSGNLEATSAPAAGSDGQPGRWLQRGPGIQSRRVSSVRSAVVASVAFRRRI